MNPVPKRSWAGALLGCKGSFVLVLLLAGFSRAATDDLKAFYSQHRWFELQHALNHMTDAPPLYVGSVAAAFNHPKRAEAYLHEIIHDDADLADEADAHEMLGYLYARQGRYRQVVKELDALLKLRPDRADVSNVRLIYAALAHYGDQNLRQYTPSTIRAEVSDEGVVVPVSIHGKTAHWLLDTDFNLPAMSESEARLMGVKVVGTSATAGDTVTGTAPVKTAVVDELVIGKVAIRNVGFLILPDSQPPMKDFPPGRRGLVGLPIALALQNLEWRSDGTFRIGYASNNHNHEVNVCFDGLTPVTRVRYEGKELDFVLDTGNLAGTQLWQRFAERFSRVMNRHTVRKKEKVTEVGGTTEHEVTVIPTITLRIAGLITKLRSVPVFSKPMGDDVHYGLLGMDVFRQARDVRLDFRAMTVQMKP